MFKKLLATAIVFAIAGCGGGSGASDPATATGQFKDSNTSGLNYVSGGQSGVTGANGSFTYEVGKPVTFSVGGVTLGSTDGKSVVTPVDLVASGSSSSTSVKNIVRFLMMLDSDANPANGITISSNVQADAASWTPLDFNSAAFDTAASSIVASVSTADVRVASLPDATAAQTHLESTLRCSYAGAFMGSYSGSDNGNFGVMIDATTGEVTGVAYSVTYGLNMTLSGTSPISYDQIPSFVTGNISSGSQFTGHFTSINGIAGTWSGTLISGSFSGSRIGGDPNAVYRFTGQFTGGDEGLYSFDIDSANNATGVGYSVRYGQLFTLSGTLSGTSITATSSTGGTISGSLNTSTGSLSGNWSSSGLTGTFSGSGCKLN